MNDWKDVSLGEVLKYEQPYRYAVNSTQYHKSGIPVLTAGKSFILGYTSETDNQYSNLPVIIFDDFTTDSKYVDFPFKVKSSAMKFLKERNTNEISLKYYSEVLKTLKLDSVGGDHKRRWISEYSKIRIKSPNFTEQTRIAEILSTADEAIAHTEALIAKYQRIKTGLMQDLLTRGIDENGNIRSKKTHRFVVKNGIEVPEEWEVITFEEATSLITDFTANGSFESLRNNVKYYYSPNYARLIRLTDLRQDLKNDGVYVDEAGFKYLKKSMLIKGDILLANVGEYTGYSCLMPEVDYLSTIAPNMFLIRANVSFLSEFFQYLIMHSHFQKQAADNNLSSTTKLLNKTNLRKFLVYKLKKEEQSKIIIRINQIERVIQVTLNKLSKLRNLKTGLMQDLLSGRVRVPAASKTGE